MREFNEVEEKITELKDEILDLGIYIQAWSEEIDEARKLVIINKAKIESLQWAQGAEDEV